MICHLSNVTAAIDATSWPKKPGDDKYDSKRYRYPRIAGFCVDNTQCNKNYSQTPSQYPAEPGDQVRILCFGLIRHRC